MLDYSIFYRKAWQARADWPNASWHILLSAYNSSDRVRDVFNRLQADEKYWFISPEYGYSQDEFPHSGKCYTPSDADEATAISGYISAAQLTPGMRICVDITGFMRPHLLVLFKLLSVLGIKRVDAVYSEPLQYIQKEHTRFSDETVVEVRQVSGYEGNHIPETSNDVMIIGSGYDHVLIAHAAEYKEQARKIQMLGFPSLRADMYQQNVLRAQRASEQLGITAFQELETRFAPANDPFITANSLAEIYEYAGRKIAVSNLYLCPLSTKVQALGFALYYLTEWCDRQCSIVFPFCKTYARETSVGLARVWLYELELPISSK